MNDNEKCIECGAYTSHHPLCSKMKEASKEKIYEMLIRYYNAWSTQEAKHREACSMYNRDAQMMINRIKDERDKWMGKAITIKSENNKLRKANERK